MFCHFLVVASALFVRTSSNGFAHHSVDVPFSSVFLASFNHIFEFDQKINIFVIFFISPVRCWVSLFGIWGILEAKNNFFWSKNPRLDLVEGDRGWSDVLRLSLRQFRHTGHVIHLNDIIKNIIKPIWILLNGLGLKSINDVQA